MGFLEKLIAGLKRTKEAFSKKMYQLFAGRELDEEFYEDLENTLISSDLGVEATEQILEEFKDECYKRKIKKPEDAKQLLKNIMIDAINYDIQEYSYPLVILVAGVNGVGKTTAVGKLAKYFVNKGQSYGEWAEPTDVCAFAWYDFATPHPEESTAYTSFVLKTMCAIMTILGRDGDEDYAVFKEYSEGCKRAYRELVTKKGYTLDTDRQAKLVRPIALGLLTPEQESFAKKRLILAMEHYRWRLGTGFLSTPLILDVLASIDPKYAYRLLENEEMPGWLFMAKNDTGTIWESWELGWLVGRCRGYASACCLTEWWDFGRFAYVLSWLDGLRLRNFKNMFGRLQIRDSQVCNRNGLSVRALRLHRAWVCIGGALISVKCR